MRLAFAGTPEFAQRALERLTQAGLDVVLVLTQPDRPAGRGMKLQASPVKQFAQAQGIEVAQPRSLRLDGKYPDDAAAAQQALQQARPDAMVVAAYGLILPQWVLDLPRLGCLNIHASLLPRWRGAAPIHRAVMAGDAETGVCIMRMEAGLDTGPVLLRAAVPIGEEETTGELHDRLAQLGAGLIVQALARLPDLVAVAQGAEGVSYAAKIDKAEARIDWTRPAAEVARLIRGLSPAPGAWCLAGGERVKLLRARAVAGAGTPGEVLEGAAEALVVACGQGAVAVSEVQREGRRAMAVAEALRGWAPARLA
jgi:methionyl-tRNA formyltransferase